MAFYDVYSLDDPDMLALVPRPVHALLVIIPATDAWKKDREAEDAGKGVYEGAGPDEPVLWLKQTIPCGCGLIGLLHCVFNGPAVDMIKPGSDLDDIRRRAIPLKMDDRADVIAASDRLYEASQIVAVKGDTAPLPEEAHDGLGQHFVAFVKANDGHLWELEGGRKGPLDRGVLGEYEDALSPKALSLGIKRVMDLQLAESGDVRFSVIALAPTQE